MARRRQTSKSIGLAKLTPPMLPVVLKRLRLFRLLDKARKRPITWIATPAGSGKTTLVASYLKARRLPTLWYRLDESDADPSSFFHFLSLAAKTLAPKIRTPLPVLTPEYALGLPTFARRFFQELCMRLPRRCVMVLDNYHEVPAQAVLHQLLLHAFQEVPAHVSVIVMSRQDPPAPMAQLQSTQALAQVDADLLSLLKSETKALIQLHVRGNADFMMKRLVDEVYDRVGGWAAGVVLMLEHVKSRLSTGSNRVRDASETIFQYLASQIIERLTPDKQELLLKTSVLSDIRVPLAARLSNLPHAGDILTALHAERYFTERREGANLSYRYHPLFREFLLHRAQQVLGPHDFRALQRNAAELLVHDGCVEDAVLLFQAAEDWEGLVPVILAQANGLIEAGRIQTLELWIRSIPESVRSQIPLLNFWLASTRMPFNPDEAYLVFEQVFQQFRACDDHAGTLMAWCGGVQSVLFGWVGIGRLSRWLSLFPVIHPDGTPYPSIQIEAQVATSMANALVQYQPDRSDTRAWLRKAERLADYLSPASAAGTRYIFDAYHLWIGDIPSAVSMLDQFQRYLRKQRATPLAWIVYYVIDTTVGWYLLEFEQSRESLRKARVLANESGVHVLDHVLLGQATYAELLTGNLAMAEALLKEQASLVERTSGVYRTHYEFLVAWLMFLRNDLEHAWAHIHQSINLLRQEGDPKFPTAFTGILAADILAELGEIDEAAKWLNRINDIAEQLQSDYLKFGMWLVSARIAFDGGNDARGHDALQKALAVGETRGLMQYPGMKPNVLAQLCSKALEGGLQVTFVQRMIRKHRLSPPLEARLTDTWPWLVKIHTFGKLEVEVDGLSMERRRKAPHRLLELLIAIIAFGGQDVPVVRLIDALWPDADGDQAQENLKKSIARLRKLLTVENVILWHDGRISLNSDLCWVDALAFDKLAKQHEERTIPLYKGPFLGHDDIAIWAEPQRDQLRTTFVRLVNRHCDQAINAGKVEGAICSLERAVEIDPLAEPLCQRVISLLIAQGRQAEARRYYQSLSQSLRAMGKTLAFSL